MLETREGRNLKCVAWVERRIVNHLWHPGPEGQVTGISHQVRQAKLPPSDILYMSQRWCSKISSVRMICSQVVGGSANLRTNVSWEDKVVLQSHGIDWSICLFWWLAGLFQAVTWDAAAWYLRRAKVCRSQSKKLQARWGKQGMIIHEIIHQFQKTEAEI